MELSAKIIGVEQAWEGIVVVIQQDKMQIPVAEDPETDESVVAKKMSRALQGMGFNIDMRQFMKPDVGFRTGFWMPFEDYEQLGKPTVGDLLKLSVKVEK